jgi:siroheme synthase
LDAAAIGGISAGVIAGVTIAACVAAALGIWGSKKGYDHYMAKTEFAKAQAVNNPAFADNPAAGNMPNEQ